jgi:hypothetical protein
MKPTQVPICLLTTETAHSPSALARITWPSKMYAIPATCCAGHLIYIRSLVPTEGDSLQSSRTPSELMSTVFATPLVKEPTPRVLVSKYTSSCSAKRLCLRRSFDARDFKFISPLNTATLSLRSPGALPRWSRKPVQVVSNSIYKYNGYINLDVSQPSEEKF